MKKLNGGCLCGKVAYTVNDNFTAFYFCHCHQCQQITGSSHAANLLCAPEEITWLKGQDYIKRFEYPGRDFTKVFCQECGSGLPFKTQKGDSLIVPAGSLKQAASILPQQNIFWAERASWYNAGQQAEHCSGFPGK